METFTARHVLPLDYSDSFRRIFELSNVEKISIVGIQFNAIMIRVSFPSEDALHTYMLRVKELLEEYHPAGYSEEGDVEVKIVSWLSRSTRNE